MKKIISRYLAVLILLLTIVASCDKYEQEENQNKSSLLGTLSGNPDLSVFYKALETTGLDKSLDSLSRITPLTIFAPNNNALAVYFEKNGYATLDDVPKLELKKIILGYIIPGINRVERIVVDPTNPSSDIDETIEAQYLETKTYTSIASLFKDFESMDNSLAIGVEDNWDKSIQTLTIAGESVAASAKDIVTENAIIHIVGNLGTLPKEPLISSVSNKYPVSGEIVTVTGVNFYNISLITLGTANLDIIPGTLTTTKFDIKIPADFEYGLLTVKTSYGKSNQVKIGVEPAPPTINSFNPINAVSGDEVTILGDGFVRPIVTLSATATQPEVSLTIVSYTLDKIVVKIPDNANYRKISVTNAVGTGTSASAIGSSIYDDKFYAAYNQGGWGISNVNLTNTTTAEVAQGVKAIKYDIDAWSGLQVDFPTAIPVPAGAVGIRFQMKVSTPCTIGMVINQSNWGSPVTFSLNGEYAEYVIKWADLGLTAAPASINSIVFFNNGTATTQYVDDIGFKL